MIDTFDLTLALLYTIGSLLALTLIPLSIIAIVIYIWDKRLDERDRILYPTRVKQFNRREHK